MSDPVTTLPDVVVTAKTNPLPVPPIPTPPPPPPTLPIPPIEPQTGAEVGPQTSTRQWMRWWRLKVWAPTSSGGVPLLGTAGLNPSATPSPAARRRLRLPISLAEGGGGGSSQPIAPAPTLPIPPIPPAQTPLPATAPATIIDLTYLRTVFQVESPRWQSPKTGFFKIYNVSPTLIRVITTNLWFVTFECGYLKGPHYTIFDGQIQWFEEGRESPTDTYLALHAMDSDIQHNFAVVNQPLPAGSTDLDVVKACADAMGIPIGYIMPLNLAKNPRGRALHGMARDQLTQIADKNLAKWWIDGGQLYMMPQTTVQANTTPYQKQSIVVLNSQTGLIGVPHLQMGSGVSAQCLLNGRITPNSLVQINNEDIFKSQVANNQIGNPGQLQEISNTSLAMRTDGIYQVMTVKHSGDTRGNDWFTEIVTMAADPQVAVGSGEQVVAPRT